MSRGRRLVPAKHLVLGCIQAALSGRFPALVEVGAKALQRALLK